MENRTAKVKLTDPTRILTVANLISLMRAVLAIPIIYSLQNPAWRWITASLIILAVVSDTLDGFLARRAHEVTHIGKWLDPMADFTVIIAVTFYMVLFGQFPIQFFIFYLLRYLAIAVPAVYILNHTHFVMSANRTGKAAAFVTALTVSLHIFRFEALEWLRIGSLWVAAGLLLISWARYTQSFIRQIKAL